MAEVLPGLEPEAALDFLALPAVAWVAMLDQDRPNLFLEKLKTGRVRLIAGQETARTELCR